NPPQWLEDAMKNLGYKLPSSTEDQSLNLPSFPEGLEQEAIIHYYADVGDEDEQDEVEFQEDAQENEINLEVLPHEPHHPEETESQDGRGYAQIGTPPSLMNNSCTVPSWYVSPHLLSTSSSSPSSSFAMPPWMQASAGQPTPLSTTGANPFSSGQPNPFSVGGPDPLSIGQPNALSKGILNPFSVGQSNTVSAGKENPKA
ncbi:hypothetical protein KI387_037543, partial [Taxus chinensis]